MKKNQIRELIKKAEIETDLHHVQIKAEQVYIDQDCGGSVAVYCDQFTSKKTGRKKDLSNHYKLVPTERLVIKGYKGRDVLVEVTHEVK